MTTEEEPTTAAEMELMEELKRLVEATDEQIDAEDAQQLEADLVRTIMYLHAVVERAEQIAALRRAKGLPPVSQATGPLLAEMYERARQLRDQLEGTA